MAFRFDNKLRWFRPHFKDMVDFQFKHWDDRMSLKKAVGRMDFQDGVFECWDKYDARNRRDEKELDLEDEKLTYDTRMLRMVLAIRYWLYSKGYDRNRVMMGFKGLTANYRLYGVFRYERPFWREREDTNFLDFEEGVEYYGKMNGNSNLMVEDMYGKQVSVLYDWFIPVRKG